MEHESVLASCNTCHSQLDKSMGVSSTPLSKLSKSELYSFAFLVGTNWLIAMADKCLVGSTLAIGGAKQKGHGDGDSHLELNCSWIPLWNIS
ncbi:hypothetical protein GUJ93_ZPchr0012g18876 [Zizania palustris]|uniref:Uncharacterized protein n=1 Tax=Zizania palustris TaxID=103762 RepID=A0A8J5WRR0_ZIZPA|nr:hypothetical protein GUJ93_ZPchr0012g18876 [Zizania palustris]